jgi:hypothetical protein
MPVDISDELKGNLTAEQLHNRQNDIHIQRGTVPDGPRNFGPQERDWTPELHRPTFSDAQLAAVRADYVRLGLDVAAFDRATKRDGTPVTPPPDAATKAAFDEAALPHDPHPYDYTPDVAGLRQTIPDDQRRGEVVGTVSEMCADVGMDRVLGTTFIEQAVAVGNEVRDLTPDQYDNWKSRQNSMLVRSAGNLAEAAAMHQRAISVLGRAKSDRARAFAKGFKEGRGFASAQLISLLNTHALQLDLLKTAQKE